MKSKYLFIIIIITLLSTNCSKTLFLNQKAEILSHKRKESTFVGTFDVGFALQIYYSLINLNFCLGFQQRFGISLNDKREYYFSVLSNITFNILQIPYIYLYRY